MEDAINIIHEVEIHYSRPVDIAFSKVTNVEEANIVFRDYIDLKKIDHKEFFWALFLSRNNMVLGITEVGKGSICGVIVNTKEIFQLAILTNASAILLAHNHPSGNLKPSMKDVQLTQKIKDAGKLLDIDLLDHLILTTEGVTSLFTDHTF